MVREMMPHHRTLSSSPRPFRWLGFGLSGLLLASTLTAADPEAPNQPEPIKPLTIRDGHFVDAEGKPVRFWGVNLVSLFPTQEQAESIADTLAERQINLVRPHHLLRPSGDWNPEMVSGAIVTYKNGSREFDPKALERFDYLNAALRKRGIYLALSTHFSRTTQPEDVDVLKTTDEDRQAWIAAMQELNSWNWKKSIDLQKSLPVVDERAALVSEEFNSGLLTHINPHTAKSYAEDPQVLTMEVLNESSLEYAIICGNRFPDYFQKKLEEKWRAFCEKNGVEPGDLYKVSDAKTKALRAQFLRGLDEAYFLRMKSFLTALGSKIPLTYSNLWRGDNVAEMHQQHADWMEGHGYLDPRLVDQHDDGIFQVNRNALKNKPFFIGELNQAEGGDNIQKQKPYRTMLEAGIVAYGLLQDWDGLVWFAWNHGDRHIAPDGTSKEAGRDAKLGEMMSDHMMQDHLRSLGHVFRQGLIRPSKNPQTVWVDEPFHAGDYHGLMRGKTTPKPGWQAVHGFRKAYGPVPAAQAEAVWMTQSPGNPVVSDTGEIVKDTERKQLTVTAPQVEILSGQLDERPPQGPKHLAVDGNGDFVTVVLTTLDGKPLTESRHLLLSRTLLNKDLTEISDLPMTLKGLAASGDSPWQFLSTRTRTDGPAKDAPALALNPGASGELTLPTSDWTEAEIRLP